MNDSISIALVGIGGYGNNFVNVMLDAPPERKFRFAGTIDPSPASCRRLEELKARKVPHYSTLDAFLAADRADLVVISTPLHLHAAQTCQALAQGSHVLCEKPLCVTVEQARQMRDARDRTGKVVAIGYQWSFCDAIQRLKADVISGALGKAKRLKCMVLWPRDEAYYGRNRWAGAKQDAQGNLVLDSPVNNACAHYLHNMLYVLGPLTDRSASPVRLTAELYRAHPIQNYDTAALRCQTENDAELLFVVSHATVENRGPLFEYRFENATVELSDKPGASIIARFNDGSTRDYGSPNSPGLNKLWRVADAIQSNAVIPCGIETSFPHTQCVLAAQETQIVQFPPSTIRIDGEDGHRKTTVNGLGETLSRCYAEWKLPSEIGVSWAKRGNEVMISGAL